MTGKGSARSIFLAGPIHRSICGQQGHVRQNKPPAGRVTFEDLYAEHAAGVLSLLWLFGVAESDREDVAQEVWAGVHRSLSTFDPGKGTARGWITGIARNATRDWKRTRKRRPEFSTPTDQEPITTHTAEIDAAEAQRRAALGSYCERVLPNEDQCEAFLLHVIHELTIEEVAEATGALPCTVRWRIAMARRRLKQPMTEEERRKLLAILPVMNEDTFVQALRDTKFPAGESARVWDRVKARIEAEGGSIHDPLGPPSPPPPAAAPRSYTLTRAQLASTLGGTFLIGALAGATAFYTVASRDPRASKVTIEAEIPLAPLPTLAPAPEPTPTASATPSAHRSPAPPSTASEAWLLDRARKAVPVEALSLTEQHAQTFPHSTRAAAREEIAIKALLKLGRRAEAEERAASLLRWAPDKRPAMEALIGRSFF